MKPYVACADTIAGNHFQRNSLEENTVPSFKNTNIDVKCTFSTSTDLFRRTWYPEATTAQWNNWKWQIANRIETNKKLQEIFILSPEETALLSSSYKAFPFAITPYYASLVDRWNCNDPLRKTVIPVISEQIQSSDEAEDPLCENSQSPVPGIIHRYPDRVLFLVTQWCSTYCRYCTRSRMVGKQSFSIKSDKSTLLRAIEYIRSNPSIRDVLISGGDPLTLDNKQLEWILKELRTVPHVEILRIGTKVPVVLPQRITPDLVSLLKKYHPLWMSIHFTHPSEITPEVQTACTLLADAGIPLGSQTVLLSGVNDTTIVLKTLFQKVMQLRVKPYYLYQCDPINGSKHFRTTVKKGIDIISALQGTTSGYAIPKFVIDAPGGGGKIPIESNRNTLGKNGRIQQLINYEGKTYSYPDTVTENLH